MHQTRAQLVQTRWKFTRASDCCSHTQFHIMKGKQSKSCLGATGRSYVLDSWPVYGILAGLSPLALRRPRDLNVNEYFVSPWDSGQDEQGWTKRGGGAEMEEGVQGVRKLITKNKRTLKVKSQTTMLATLLMPLISHWLVSAVQRSSLNLIFSAF